jgi:hypothetical protein
MQRGLEDQFSGFHGLRSVANVEKRLADHCDNQWLTEL